MKQRIYYGGPIITMEHDAIADFLICEDGKIVSVEYGELSPHWNTENAEFIDLHGAALLPAFIDSHSHIFSYGISLLQLSLKDARSFEEIQHLLAEYIRKNHIEKGTWIQASGYDHTQLKEQNHITADILDQVSQENPVVITHQSGHMGVFNSKALSYFNITENTVPMDGGRIEIKDGQPTGYIEEKDFITRIKSIPLPNVDTMTKAIKQAQYIYASYGITTAQEGLMVKELLPLYRHLTDQNQLYLDIIGYAAPADLLYFKENLPKCYLQQYRQFKIGGIKIFLDGSPQGHTAWMKTPYKNGKEPNYFGYPSMTTNQVEDAIEFAISHHLQLLAHCNGDQAAEQFIQAVKTVNQRHNSLCKRPVIIHAQLLSPDQLPEVKKLGIIPSFFISHIYYWGDTHILSFGLNRASKISPAAAASAQNIPFTLHQDTPVIEPNMLETLWCACNRLTKEGIVLGKEQRLTIAEGLKALTIHGAYQYGKEDQIGSLKIGKQEDLVILDQNPLSTNVDQVKEISVLRTIKGGKTIYCRETR